MKINEITASNSSELTENLHQWFKEKWVRFGPDGKIRGDCARGDASEGKPKCLPQSKAHSLGKKARASAARRKRRQDPNPERKGAAINVNTKKKTNEQAIEEKWSQKYKNSVNCSYPKGFSQRAHCASKKKTNENFSTSRSKPVEFKLKTLDLHESQIVAYVKKYFEVNNIDQPHGKFISCIKHLASNKLSESIETKEIKPFIDLVQSCDSPKTIKVGDKFSVLEFEIIFAYKEINARGFMTPKEVVEIKLHSDGRINYVMFKDGDRYPRLTPAHYQGKPVTIAAYFTQQQQAEQTMTALMLHVPDGWDLDTKGIQNTMKEQLCPHCKGPMFSELMINEKKDACYYKVKSRYKVWPSAYASGALVKCRKKGSSNWGNKNESADQKIAGRYDPDEFDAMIDRLGKQAKEGARQTVWDPVTQRYKTVPMSKPSASLDKTKVDESDYYRYPTDSGSLIDDPKERQRLSDIKMLYREFGKFLGRKYSGDTNAGLAAARRMLLSGGLKKPRTKQERYLYNLLLNMVNDDGSIVDIHD